MVRTKCRLNSSLLGRGWFEFCRQLEYKLVWHAVSRNTPLYPAKGSLEKALDLSGMHKKNFYTKINGLGLCVKDFSQETEEKEDLTADRHNLW
jgi:hypothetical protein